MTPEGVLHQTQQAAQALLHAGKELFAARGFDGATVKDIADRASVNVSLVSYYFGGKEGLYREVLESFGRKRLAISERLLATTSLSDGSTESHDNQQLRLRLFVEDFLECHLRDPEICTILQRDLETEHPDCMAVFMSTFMVSYRNLEEFIRAMQSRGMIREGADAEFLAFSIFSSLMNGIRLDALRLKLSGQTLTDPAFRKHFTDQLIEQFFKGCRPA